MKVSVYRYNPDQDAAPFMQEFQVDTGGKDLMVLDVLALDRRAGRRVLSVALAAKVCARLRRMNINGKTAWRITAAVRRVVKATS